MRSTYKRPHIKMAENEGNGGSAAGGPATPLSVTTGNETVLVEGKRGALISPPDGQYIKAVLKGEIKITKLTPDNYQSWSDGMELLLDAKMLWPIVDGSIKAPDPITRPVDYRNWTFDDKQAKAWIYVNIEDSQHNHVKGLKTSNSVWEALRKVHGAQGRGRLNYLLKKFYNYKAGATETIDDVASELTNLQMMIRDIRSTEAPTDLNVALTLIDAVDNESYTMAKYYLEGQDDLSLADTKERLKLVEQKLRDETSKDGEKANIAGKGPRGTKRKCYHCDQPGHIKIKCFKWLATDEGKEYLKTHPDQAAKSNEDPAKRETKKPSTRKRSSNKAKAAKEDSDSEDSESAWLIREDEDGNSLTEDEDCAFMARTQDDSMNAWTLDSGASRHMTPNAGVFTTKRPFRKSVKVASGEVVYTEGIGNIRFDLDGQTVRMTDVLHVPGLDANLLSISALNRKGFDVLFRQSGVEIREGGTLVATGIMRGRMYYLQTSLVALLSKDAETPRGLSDTPTTSVDTTDRQVARVEPQGASLGKSTADFSLYELWHARMGHINPRRLSTLSKHVKGLDVLTPPSLENLNCTVCNYSNMTRTVNRETPRRATRKLGRVHTDIWGPYRVASLGGHKHFVSLIDDLTRKSWLICLKTRGELHAKLKEWESVVSLETGEKVTTYRCDNAKEYQKVEKNVHDAGTRMEFTTAYTPEENGVAERFNRTIIQMTRAMLMQAQLPQSFWGEAAVTANYLRNTLPGGQDDQSPIELWNGYKPEVSHIRTFGCVVHVHIPSETRAKLDRVSFQGIFVGYHSNQQVRVCNPVTRKVQWHTAVKFIENQPGGTFLGEGRSTLNMKQLQGPDDQEPSEDDEDDENDENVGNNRSDNLQPTSNPTPKSGSTEAPNEGRPAPNNLTLENSSSNVNQPVGVIENVVSDPSSGNILGEDNALEPPPNSGEPTSSTAPGPISSEPNQQNPTRKSKGKSRVEPTRRSTRNTKAYDKYQFDNESGRQARLPERRPEPSNYKEATMGADNRLWVAAIKKELDALIANGTWELVQRPSKDVNIITSKWVFKIKYTSTGHLDRYKTRLVARGYTQVHGIDYEETFAPTLRLESLCILLAFASYFGFEIEQMHVLDAYLKGDLKEVIYMEVPQGYELPKSQQGQILRLMRPLYGLKQSGREWNAKIKKELSSMNFIPINSDGCVFANFEKHVIIALYVDDLLILSKSMTNINAVKKQLFKRFNMKDEGKASFILGIRIRRDAKGRLAIDQSTYIRKFLQDFGLENSRPVSTPIDGYHALTPFGPDDQPTDQTDY